MIHILLGTKGQLIKMAPIMLELSRRSIDYNFIHTGQHTEITERIMKIFELKPPDIFLDQRVSDITEVGKGILWSSKNILKYSIRPYSVFKPKKGICLVHGDAFPAIQGLILAKFARIKVGHVEAGERTHNLREPFPEEIIRVLVDRWGDYLFASSDGSYKNLMDEKVKGRKFNVKLNTVFDAIRIALRSEDVDVDIPSENYVVATIHRLETIRSKGDLQAVIDTLGRISKEKKVLFVLHEPTKNKLISFNLMDKLRKMDNIQILPLQEYFSFMKLVKHSDYIVTDGGGPQQESYYLEKPCLLMRRVTERENYPNVCLSEFKKEKIDDFIKNFERYRHRIEIDGYSPSKEIVEIITNEINRGV